VWFFAFFLGFLFPSTPHKLPSAGHGGIVCRPTPVVFFALELRPCQQILALSPSYPPEEKKGGTKFRRSFFLPFVHVGLPLITRRVFIIFPVSLISWFTTLLKFLEDGLRPYFFNPAQ